MKKYYVYFFYNLDENDWNLLVQISFISEEETNVDNLNKTFGPIITEAENREDAKNKFLYKMSNMILALSEKYKNGKNEKTKNKENKKSDN